jgi:hypothetical protein
VADDINWFRKFYEFPGTDIAIYEANSPLPEIVHLTMWNIRPGPTKSHSQWDPDLQRSVNVHAGEEEQLKTPKKRIDGLGADEPPRRRIVGTTTVQQRVLDPTKELPRDATPAERAAWTKAVTRAFEKQRQQEKRMGVQVRGWRMRALSAEKERELFDQSSGAAATVAALFKRIPKDQKAWLQSGDVPYEDPYRFLQTKKGERGIYTPWVRSDCIGWLVAEAAKLGVYFSTKPPKKVTDPSEASQLKLDVENYLSGKTQCAPKVVREKGVRASARVLKIGDLQPLSISALNLFLVYQEALREADDKNEVHEAYHRILLHRFLRRRTLVPQASRTSRIGEEAERRAQLLQAHRVFVFDQRGCPTRLNQRLLEANGIDINALGKKNPLLIYERNLKNQYIVNEWTKWLFEDVLRKDPVECRSIFTSESFTGLSALAELGFLG